KILSKIISARSSKIKSRRDNKRKKKEAFLQEQQKVEQAIREERIIKCRKEVTVKELADKMGINPTEIVKFLFMQGKMHNVNSFIPFSLAEEVAENYNVLIEPEKEIEKYIDVKHEVTEGINRPPVVTVMGHVDHG
ncbi:MAG TPA: translation initiation factor IF-2, partial [Fusobacteria bacterium]|nr:translation initiation factor IF-2 [Fusobacteriota bacterium]